jgi:hypothetical protein
MAKSYEPIKLTIKQALKAIAKGDRLQSVCYEVEGQFKPSDDPAQNQTYIEELYKADGYIKSISHLSQEEQSLYLDARYLHGNAQFVEMLNRWNENDLAVARANKQRITNALRQNITTANQNRLTEAFRLLAPATIRQDKLKAAGATGGKKSQNTKATAVADLTKRIKSRYNALLESKDAKDIAGILANEFALTAQQIRNHLKKAKISGG